MLSLQNIRNFLKLNWSEFRHICGREQYVCRTGGGGGGANCKYQYLDLSSVYKSSQFVHKYSTSK
jgi:hypothetical protein